MYKEFFALSENPFRLTPDPEFLYMSQNHKEALAHLTYGVESQSGFVMVTGEVGAGKTTLLRTLVRNLSNKIVLSQVTNTRVSYKELLELILDDFGLETRGLNKTALLSVLNDFLIEKFREGLNCVVVVDEAQNLSQQTLEGLRMLSNLETEKAKLIHIILAGQPGLRDLIDSEKLEQLRQRITVRYHLGPLSAGEVGEYIQHRLGKVVTDAEKAPVFPDAVVPVIHDATGGIPRLVNIFCDTALVHAYATENRTITEELASGVAEQLIRDQQGSGEPAAERQETRPRMDEQRLLQLERQLQEVTSALRLNPLGQGERNGVAAAGHDADMYQRMEVEIARRESALREREHVLERREQEFNRRVERLKGEWKRRLKNLTASRDAPPGGEKRFPPLCVYVYEPDPRLRDALQDLLDSAGIPYEAYGVFQEMLEALQLSHTAGWFAVSVVGAGADDSANEEHVIRLVTGMPHLPVIYLSDIDLSTIRRRMFAAGANYFVEKPNGQETSFTTHRESLGNLKSDLLRSIHAIHRQQQAVFESLCGLSGAVESSPSEIG